MIQLEGPDQFLRCHAACFLFGTALSYGYLTKLMFPFLQLELVPALR